MPAAQELAPTIGIAAACQAVGLARSSFYRAQEALPRVQNEPRPAPTSPRALSPDEKAQLRQVLDSERFQDCAPREV